MHKGRSAAHFFVNGPEVDSVRASVDNLGVSEVTVWNPLGSGGDSSDERSCSESELHCVGRTDSRVAQEDHGL